MVETTYGGLLGFDGPYEFEHQLFADFFSDALLVLGIVGLLLFLYLVFRPLVRGRGARGGGPRARPRDRPRQRLRHARLLRAAPRQELLLLRRRPLAGRLRLRPRLRDGRRRPDRPARGRRRGPRRVPRLLRRAGLEGGVPRGPRGRDAAVPRARHALALPRRRGDPPLPRLQPRRRRHEGGPLGRQPGRQGPPLRADQGDRRLRGRWSTSSTRSARSGATAPRSAASRWSSARTSRASRRTSCSRSPASRRGDGRVAGFLRFVPCYGPDPGYSLDLMRRRPDSANGLTEYLIANAALSLGASGVERLSLNFAAWGRLLDESEGMGIGGRLQRRVAKGAQPVLPDPVAARLQREVRPRVAAALDRRSRTPPTCSRSRLLYASDRGLRRGAARRALPRPAGPQGRERVATADAPA